LICKNINVPIGMDYILCIDRAVCKSVPLFSAHSLYPGMLMITPLSTPMTTLNAISEMIEYSHSLTTPICELIGAAHISKQVNSMIATLRKEGHQIWKHIETLEREILISQDEATPEPSEGVWQTPLLFSPLKMCDRPADHRHHLHLEVCEPMFARFSRPDEAEPFPKIATSTAVPVRMLYHRRDAYNANPRWRLDHSSHESGRAFTGSEEQDLAEHVRTHYLTRHLRLTMQSMGTIILA
jgi:hypothetical protein